jgi:CheY-like chemotaxis protein
MLLVAVSGWGQDADRMRSIEAGFDHHLVKPVDMEALQGMLPRRRGSNVHRSIAGSAALTGISGEEVDRHQDDQRNAEKPAEYVLAHDLSSERIRCASLAAGASRPDGARRRSHVGSGRRECDGRHARCRDRRVPAFGAMEKDHGEAEAARRLEHGPRDGQPARDAASRDKAASLAQDEAAESMRSRSRVATRAQQGGWQRSRAARRAPRRETLNRARRRGHRHRLSRRGQGRLTTAAPRAALTSRRGAGRGWRRP